MVRPFRPEHESSTKKKHSIGIKIGRRRARSAPPRVKNSLIENYYNVDTFRNVVLPGVPSYDQDWHRDIHDFFNLMILVPVVVSNALNWDWDMLLSFPFPKEKMLEAAWIGDWNNAFYRITWFYFILDLAWILIFPQCVKSPVTIIVHHCVCLAFCSVPLLVPGTYYLMGLNMSVEANTWFLIARRVFNKQGFPPWTISLPPLFSIRIKLISVFFYFTWFFIRLIVFPAVLVKITQLYIFYSKVEGATACSRALLVAVVFQSTLCFLNLKWTKDLVMAKLRFSHKGRKQHMKGL